MSGFPKLEFAYFPDGRVLVGTSNRGEAGGFDVVGDVTEAVSRLTVRTQKAAQEPLRILERAINGIAGMIEDAGREYQTAIEQAKES